MFTRIGLAALLVAVGPSLAAAQGSTAPLPAPRTAPLPAPPMKTAPTSGQTNAGSQTNAGGQNAIINPPAARSGEKGLSGNPDEPVTIKRLK